MSEREERVSEEVTEMAKQMKQSKQGLGTRSRFLDVPLDVVLSVLAGGGGRSGPAVSIFLKLAQRHCWI